MLKKQRQEVEEHHHSWAYVGRDLSCERCMCGDIKVSVAEYERREEEWNNYYDMVRTTEAFADFQEMKKAYHSRDKVKIAEINKRIADRQEADEYLPKPSFPDPSTWRGYYVEG